jgi:APA family basic amino acid/polyamine antiporter
MSVGPAPTLQRTLGLRRVTLTGIGVILGAGVYALIAPAAQEAGGLLWLAFVVAGVAAGLTAYAYARLGAMQPKASPEFQYTALAFGPRVGFVVGWLMLVADVCAAGAVALGFAGYMTHLVGTPLVANALGLMLVIGVVLTAGVRQSVGAAIVLTGIELVGLLIVIAVGLPAWGDADFTASPHGLAGVGAAAALIFFAYLGFDELGNFAEEMREPERNLPRALCIALAATTLIYIAVALSATAVVPWQTLAASPAPLALVVGQVMGPAADRFMALVALAATANTVLLLLAAAARSVYGMAAAGVLPRRLSRVGRTQVPLPATWLVLAGAGALVLVRDLRAVALMTDAAVLLSFLGVNASLVWLGLRGRTRGGARRRAADVLVPAVAILLCGWLMVHTGWLGLVATAVLAAVGLVMAVVMSRLPGRVGPA